MTLSFTVNRPISVNGMYGRRADAGKGSSRRGLILTSEGRLFKARIVAAATAARMQSAWPSNIWRVRRAELSYQLYDCRLDTDGPRKPIKDSLERVLYENDRLVQDGPSPFPIMDGRGHRVEVTVRILELCDDLTARALEAKALAARVARQRRKARKFPAAYQAKAAS